MPAQPRQNYYIPAEDRRKLEQIAVLLTNEQGRPVPLSEALRHAIRICYAQMTGSEAEADADAPGELAA